jgi:hypothetical protein
MSEQQLREVNEKLASVVELLQFVVALELLKNGVPKDNIRQKLGIAQVTMTDMLRGIRVEKNAG